MLLTSVLIRDAPIMPEVYSELQAAAGFGNYLTIVGGNCTMNNQFGSCENGSHAYTWQRGNDNSEVVGILSTMLSLFAKLCSTSKYCKEEKKCHYPPLCGKCRSAVEWQLRPKVSIPIVSSTGVPC